MFLTNFGFEKAGIQSTHFSLACILNRNQSFDLQCKSNDWFLYKFNIELKRVNCMISVMRKTNSLREKCPYSEFFWSVFCRIRTEYGEIRSIYLYSVWMGKNKDQKNSEYGHFSCPYSVWMRKIRTRKTVNTDTFHVPIQSECGKIRTRKTVNTDTFHAATTISNILIGISIFV